MDDNRSSFPFNSSQSLALIYCMKHANDSTSATELYDMYQKALNEIQDYRHELKVNS